MNNDAAEQTANEIFDSSILHNETCASLRAMGARRLRAEGRAGWASDYDALAAEHAGNAGEDRGRAAELVARLAAIRAA